MHELSIALSMIEGVEEELEKHGEALVQAVHVRVGVLSGVDVQALRFAYELACEGTALAGSRLDIETIPLLVYCPQCTTTHVPAAREIFCPRCITPEQEVLTGRELEVSALELVA